MAELVGHAEAAAGIAPAGLVTPEDAPLLYQAGPVSQLLAWLEKSTPRLWLFTGGLSLAVLAWAHAVLWSSGRLTPWTIDANAVVLTAYMPFALLTWGYGVRIARAAVKAFWPATGWVEGEQRVWIYRFSTIPVRLELVALLAGLLVAVGAIVAAPAAIVGPETGRIASFIALFPIFVGGYMGTAVGIVFSLRALRLVAEIHREARAINPFDRVPIYAFSRLTVYIGLAIVAGTYYTLTLNAPTVTGNVPALLMMPVTTAIGIGAFIVPLWGIHQRLVRTKERLLDDVERRTSAIAAELYQRVDAGAFDTAKPVADSLTAVNTLRERVRHIQTWPWPPNLFRAFVSALLLPIVIYLITRLIGAILPA